MHAVFDGRNQLMLDFYNTVITRHPYRPTGMVEMLPSFWSNIVQSSQSLLLRFVSQRYVALDAFHEQFECADGGTVCTVTYLPDLVHSKTPVLVFFPTFAGSSFEYHPFLTALTELQKWIVVVYHKRGIHCPLTAPAVYTGGNDDDAHLALTRMHQRYPDHPMFALGQSAGGSHLLRYLGKYRPTFIWAAATISSAIHTQQYENIPKVAAASILSHPKRQMREYFSKNQARMTAAQIKIYEQALDETHARQFIEKEGQLHTKSLDEFNKLFQTQLYLRSIPCPTLVINSEDDSISANPMDFKSWIQSNSNLMYLITAHGGHCGYVATDKHLKRFNWAEFMAFLFFFHVLQKKLPSSSATN